VNLFIQKYWRKEEQHEKQFKQKTIKNRKDVKMRKVLNVLLSLFIIFAFIVAVAPDAMAKKDHRNHHEQKLHGKVHGDNNAREEIILPNVYSYWWNNNGIPVVEVSISNLNYPVEIYKNGVYLDTLFPPTAKIGDNSKLVLVNELRARIPVNAAGVYNIEVRVNVTKRLYIEFSNQVDIPTIEAYLSGVSLNGDVVNIKYNLYPLFENVTEGNHVEVEIDGMIIGTGQVVKNSWGQLEFDIAVSPDTYHVYIMGYRETTLKIIETGVTMDISPYYWTL
jgi:hypothetical protein